MILSKCSVDSLTTQKTFDCFKKNNSDQSKKSIYGRDWMWQMFCRIISSTILYLFLPHIIKYLKLEEMTKDFQDFQDFYDFYDCKFSHWLTSLGFLVEGRLPFTSGLSQYFYHVDHESQVKWFLKPIRCIFSSFIV
jgi:hypothetical protein